jgi:hypothetical protein
MFGQGEKKGKKKERRAGAGKNSMALFSKP